jgi:hypothetical protein
VGSRHPLVHEGLVGDDGRDRHPGGNPLGDRHDVGHDPEMLERPHLAGAAHPGLDLVQDQQDAVPVAQLPHEPQPSRRGHHVAALTGDGLDQHRRHVVGHHELVEQLFQLGEVAEVLLLRAALVGGAEQVRVGREVDTRQERLVVPRTLTRLLVTLIAAWVRPWKAPRKAMIAGRPVAILASFRAPSVASAPELVQKTWFRLAGRVDVSARAAFSIGSWARMFAWAWMILPACSRIASTTLGWQWPVLTTPMPEV